MNQRVMILRDAIVKITQMMSGKGIEVTQRGITAYVKADKSGKPVLVNLPYLPDNATEELITAIQGFLDHEVAHILFSDFTVAGVADKEGIHAYTNILEDARIEKRMAEKFTGTASNLSSMGDFFLDKYITPRMKQAAAEGNAAGVIGVLFVPLLRAMSGQFIYKDYMKDKMHIVQSVYDKIADMEPAITSAKSTQECLELAREIKKRLQSSEPPKPEEKPEQKGSDGQPGKPDDEKKPEEKKEEKPKKAKAPKKPKEEEEKKEEKDEGEGEGGAEKGEGEAAGEEEGEEGEGAGEGAGEGEGEGEGGEEGEDGEEGEGEAAEMGSGEGGDGDGERPEEAKLREENNAAINSAIDKESANGYDDAVSTLISAAAAKSAHAAPYLVFTKDHDVVEPLRVGKGYLPSMFTSMADKVDHMVGPLQKDLERAIAARSLATWEPGRRSGRLHAANLTRLAVGDTRVFRKRHEANSKDVAVSLVIDASGSMSGGKIHLATQAAYALSSVLERIGIKHEVICFTTGPEEADRSMIAQEEAKMKRRYSRTETLFMPVVKEFNERLLVNVKERFGWLPNANFLRNNIDGECIQVAAHRLMARRETGKVMIVLSDGSPNARGGVFELGAHLKKTVGEVTQRGVKVIGIGIQTDSVKEFYPKHVIISKVEELPNRVIKELRAVLTA